MNAFFASVEQRDFPSLLGQPIAVTNGLRGSCVITSSYEARAQGVRTGMRLKQARQLCPSLIQRASRPEVYAGISTRIMQAIHTVCPDMEVFSVDEAFIDITPCQQLYGSPIEAARLIKQSVYRASGLLCSIGISGDKTTAKYAAKLNKPDGFTVIPPWESRERLRHVAVTELCGIGEKTGLFLAKHGVRYCGDMEKLPISVLARRFGNPGRRIWYMCQGEDPEPLHTEVTAPKSIGHGKVMAPNTRSRQTILTYLQHMCSKVGARLRRHDFEAHTFWFGLRTEQQWLGEKVRLPEFSSDHRLIYQYCQQKLNHIWKGQGIWQIQITALDPRPAAMQMDMFASNPEQLTHDKQLNSAMDDINQRYGEFTLSPARLLNRSDMPNVIAPSWKPAGHRKTI
ncbi:MAG: DNA polymerase IV [Gammaproteobacteria bacterium]|nr:DNA polymerase IV [Gammaproteobacteria bacterium]MCK5262837.1 DNA polymerase IV [Gammaproteobacteria bacterium]